MPIYKMCPSCHSKFEYGKSCPKGCYKKFEEEKAKWRKEANLIYDKEKRKNSIIYNSPEWKTLREVSKSRFDFICLWSYYKYNKIVQAELVHHIVELNEDETKALDIDNLIPLTDKAHREIHQLYKWNKQETQEEIFEMIRKWQEKNNF